MIAPVVAGVAALYGYYRWKKAKEQAAIDAALAQPAPIPGAAAHPGFTPSRTTQSIAKAVSSVTGLGAKLPSGTYGKTATTSDVPSGRIPSSLYGSGGAPGPTPAPSSSSASAGVSVSTGVNFKFP